MNKEIRRRLSVFFFTRRRHIAWQLCFAALS